MSPRLIDLCLWAYPAAIRDRDRSHVHDLATDLAGDHGFLREVFGLLRGGLVERRRQSRTRSAAAAVGATTLFALAALTWTAAAQSGAVEEDLFVCQGDCVQAEADVRSRVRDSWTCAKSQRAEGVQ